MIPDRARRVLLAIARAAVAGAVEGRDPGRFPPMPRLRLPRAGAFVTLRLGGQPRACIGRPAADRALVEAVRQCAVAAAGSDSRVPPLTRAELAELTIELSVLGPLQAVRAMHEIVVGRHGLLVQHEGRSGLLLPHVAPERGWDVRALAAHTCRKAGVPADAWPSGGALMYRFEAEVFGEPTVPGSP